MQIAADTARVTVTLHPCVRSLRGLLLGLNTQLRFPGPLSSAVGERTLMNRRGENVCFFFGAALPLCRSLR
jgi:hypothetical protein